VFERLRRFDPLECEAAVRHLATFAGVALAPRPGRQRLDSSEIVTLARHRLISVGAHSVSHPMLSRIAKAQRDREIGQSKQQLETLIEGPVTSFAYPYGAGTRAAALVREAGFRSACTTENRLVGRRADLFRLPRIFVGDWSGEELERRLGALQ
jgi:peptidoglycan/xylan/chitin deacetylase (PgdA/CDA1 family)